MLADEIIQVNLQFSGYHHILHFSTATTSFRQNRATHILRHEYRGRGNTNVAVFLTAFFTQCLINYHVYILREYNQVGVNWENKHFKIFIWVFGCLFSNNHIYATLQISLL